MSYIHGGDIYTYEGMTDFSANINPFGPSERVLQAACNAMQNVAAYPDSSCRALRQSLAEAEGISKESIVFGNGAADLIFALVFAERPKKALLTAPSFAEYGQALEAVGCQISYHYLDEKKEFVLGEEYLECLTEDLDLIFLCSPDNPTGKVIQKSLLERIAQKCEKLHIRMVLDGCFFEFQDNQKNRLPLQEKTKYPHLFFLHAFTKMHAIPGLRLGYGVTGDEGLLARLEQVRQPWSVSIPAQAAGIAAIKEKQRVADTRNYVQEQRKYLEQELQRLGIFYYRSEANYLLLRSDLDLFSLLLKKQILIRDCGNYKGLGQGYYRIAIKRQEENQLLIKALKEICQTKKRKAKKDTNDAGQALSRGRETTWQK